MLEDFTKLQLLKQAALPTFTHMDISPRNVLVSGSPSSITGLVDFEFAGFFPPEEDFANNVISNEGDWPADAYETFLDQLENLDIQTPVKGFSKSSWREAMLLMKLKESIAPWFLRSNSDIKREELLQECQNAADTVAQCIEKLQQSSIDS